MEFIVQLRQMMADQNFFEVQKLVEAQLLIQSNDRLELLQLLYEALRAQHKKLNIEILLELCSLESKHKNHDHVLQLLCEVDSSRYYIQTQTLKIIAAEEKGLMESLQYLISELFIRQFQQQVPAIPDYIIEISEKYFKTDFNLKLKYLALVLMTGDKPRAEKLVTELLVGTFEKSSPKGIPEKLKSIIEIISPFSKNHVLNIFQNLCVLSVNGIQEKADYKRVIEMILFFENFKLQVLTLDLIDKLQLKEEAALYAQCLRQNKDYSFVYFDKYFPHLKKYFFERSKVKIDIPEKRTAPDLTLEDKYQAGDISPMMDFEQHEQEQFVIQALKYQNYNCDQYCDLAVSFLQSEMVNAALKASEMATSLSDTDSGYLKSSYLKLHSLLLLKDFRAAVDTSMQALARATGTDDILSFLYGQAEALMRLDEKQQAKKILKKIISIDPGYRLAKERLEIL